MTLMKRKSNLHLLRRHPVLFARTYRWPLVVLAAGLIADSITTYLLAREYGPLGEIHPAMRMMLSSLGAGPGVAVGQTVRAAAVLLVAGIWKFWCGWLMALCGVLYLLAGVWNALQLIG